MPPDQIDGPRDGPCGQQPPQVVAAGQVQRPRRVAEALVDAVERAQGQILVIAAQTRQVPEPLAGQSNQPAEVRRQQRADRRAAAVLHGPNQPGDRLASLRRNAIGLPPCVLF